MFEKRTLFLDKEIHTRGGRELNRKHRYSARQLMVQQSMANVMF